MAQAVRNGYQITHSGVLVRTPIPDVQDQPELRMVFFELESTFAWSFSAMIPQLQPGPSMRLWPDVSYPFDGLCSHSALLESSRGLELTDEQRVEIDKHRKSRRKQWEQDYQAERKEKLVNDPESEYAQNFRDQSRRADEKRRENDKKKAAEDPELDKKRKAKNNRNDDKTRKLEKQRAGE
jgi:hypothetical protein